MQPRSAAQLAIWALAMLLAFAGFMALGTWQVHRRSWKLDLIARVDQRVHAPPVPAPPRAQWPDITAARDEYLRVCAHGRFVPDRYTLVQAITRLGGGDWVMAPLRTDAGNIILINRGFVDDQHRTAAAAAAGQGAGLQVCGLLRLTEPHGGFLRRNDPAHGRWYSRDVAAIAQAEGLPAADVAPYFIDADAASNPGAWPVGGLTVIHFRNSHLVYAITWYALALMVAAGAFRIGHHEWHLRRAGRR
jgi:surfeit locus 1 family protein